MNPEWPRYVINMAILLIRHPRIILQAVYPCSSQESVVSSQLNPALSLYVPRLPITDYWLLQGILRRVTIGIDDLGGAAWNCDTSPTSLPLPIISTSRARR